MKETVKQDILENNGRLKCGRFVNILRQRILNVCKQVNLKIRKKRCTRAIDFGDKKIKGNNCVDETFLDSVETWGNKEKQPKHLVPISYRPFKEPLNIVKNDIGNQY